MVSSAKPSDRIRLDLKPIEFTYIVALAEGANEARETNLRRAMQFGEQAVAAGDAMVAAGDYEPFITRIRTAIRSLE